MIFDFFKGADLLHMFSKILDVLDALVESQHSKLKFKLLEILHSFFDYFTNHRLKSAIKMTQHDFRKHGTKANIAKLYEKTGKIMYERVPKMLNIDGNNGSKTLHILLQLTSSKSPKVVSEAFVLIYRYFNQLSELENAYCKIEGDQIDEKTLSSLLKIQSMICEKRPMRINAENLLIAGYLYENRDNGVDILKNIVTHVAHLVEQNEKCLSLRLLNTLKDMLKCVDYRSTKNHVLNELRFYNPKEFNMICGNSNLSAVQNVFLEKNAAELVVSMIVNSDSNDIFLIEALEFGQGLLNQGCKKSQAKILMNVTSSDSPVDFFKLIVQKIENCKWEIKSDKIGGKHADSLFNSTHHSFIKNSSSEESTSHSRSASDHDLKLLNIKQLDDKDISISVLIAKKILKFLQLLCENHNTEAQNLLRDQKGKVNFDLVSETLTLLECLCGKI
jgi:hypothetical protein